MNSILDIKGVKKLNCFEKMLIKAGRFQDEETRNSFENELQNIIKSQI